MNRLGELDFPERVAPALPVWAAQLLFAAICTLIPIILRLIVDQVAYAAGPFSLVYVGVLVATLFGRWQSGVLTLVASTLYAWYFVLPAHRSFAFQVEGDGARTVVNVLALLAVVVLSETFRRAVHSAVSERDRQIEERDLLLAEFAHRVRNNFASVTALLQLQLQRADSQEARDMIQAAIGRVGSIAQANQHLFSAGQVGRVQMGGYLNDLCAALSDALFVDGSVSLICESADEMISSDCAVTIGLIVNELVTNAAKHAFPHDRKGNIRVAFSRRDDACNLSIEDDGVGMSGIDGTGGLGRRLLDALVTQLDGELTIETGGQGTRVSLTFPAD